MGSGDLVDNKHATSVDSSDVFLHGDRHYEGDEKSHCGDGVDWHGEPQRYGHFRDDLRENERLELFYLLHNDLRHDGYQGCGERVHGGHHHE